MVPAPGVPAHAQASLTSAEQPAGDESVAPDCADVGQRGRQGNGSASRRGDGSAALRPAGTDTSTEPSDASPTKSHGAPCALRAGSGYIDWAELLKRVYDIDALACPCGGRLRFIALITEKETAQTILKAMGLPAGPRFKEILDRIRRVVSSSSSCARRIRFKEILDRIRRAQLDEELTTRRQALALTRKLVASG